MENLKREQPEQPEQPTHSAHPPNAARSGRPDPPDKPDRPGSGRPMEHSAAQLVSEIANLLGETRQQPRSLIWRIVKLCGAEQALAWLQEAQAIEAAGGMMLPDESRRRTPGGVFFKVARDSLFASGQRDLAYDIFFHKPRKAAHRDETAGRPQAQQPAPASQPTEPPVTWGERGSAIAEIDPAEGGSINKAKAVFVGKPGHIVERQAFTLLQVQQSGPLPPLSRGMPRPDPVPTTTYIVYIGSKQWRKVKDALQNPDDLLILEGAQVWDEEYGAIAIFATSVTTKLQQQAQRESQRNKAGRSA